MKQDIKECLEKNYLPYAVSVITDRAIVSIDGMKPSHRKLLYTMYKMGLLKSARTKSANIVGQTMKLNPHGDGAIYETMVRLTKGYDALLIPYVDSKGNFGKVYSRDMAYAASRYTEAKLMPIAEELFKNIDSGVVDMVDNYDGSMKEPSLLPVTFPTILTNVNTGIAVGIASNICSFNLNEVCNYTIDMVSGNAPTHLVPDFTTGGELLYDESAFSDIDSSGRGSIRVRSKYKYDKENSCIDVYEIPYTTTVEAIMDKLEDLVKAGKLKEVSDVRDETDLKGLKLTIDIKKNVDPDSFMKKLFKLTPLEDSFGCNFNVLIDGKPQLLGVKSIVEHWIDFRKQCIQRELSYDIEKFSEEENELLGLKVVLLDIDKAIAIIRGSESEKEVISNLMSKMKLNKSQAEYISDIKLRTLNQSYLTKKIDRLGFIQDNLSSMRTNIESEAYYTQRIITDLEYVKKTYGKKRMTTIIHDAESDTTDDILIPDENCAITVTREGYVKRCTRLSSSHKTKEGDVVIFNQSCTTKHTLLVFTSLGNVYKVFIHELDQTLPSNLGQYLPSLLQMEKDESIISVQITRGYKGNLINVFKDNRLAKVSMESFRTAQKRTCLKNAISLESPLVVQYVLETDEPILVQSTINKVLICHTDQFNSKSSKSTNGDALIKSKNDSAVQSVYLLSELDTTKLDIEYYTGKRGATGSFLKKTDEISKIN